MAQIIFWAGIALTLWLCRWTIIAFLLFCVGLLSAALLDLSERVEQFYRWCRTKLR